MVSDHIFSMLYISLLNKKMENNNKGYKFYGDYNTVTVEQEFLMKLVNKNLNDIIDELSFLASYLHSIIINDNNKKHW